MARGPNFTGHGGKKDTEHGAHGNNKQPERDVESYFFLEDLVVLKGPSLCVETNSWHSLLGLLCLLGQEHGLDVGKHSTLGDGDSGEQLVQLLVVPDGELEVTGDDPGLLVVSGSVSCQLKDLSGQVLHDCSQVDGGSSTHSLGVVALSQVTVDTSHWELETGTG